MIDERVHVAIRSHGRAGHVTTAAVVPFAYVWAPESQADAYREHHGDHVMTIPDYADGSLARKSNAILDASPCEWTVILDDDITAIRFYEEGVDRDMTADHIRQMIEHHFGLADELGVKLWGINQNRDEMAYKPCTPFALLAPILGPLTGHLGPTLRYDESVLGKDDYDFWLQNIATYHRTLRANRYHYIHDHGRQRGGFVAQRTKAVEWAGVDRMIAKWGDKVFRVGGSPGARRNRKATPTGNVLNSMVRVPIKGC